MPDILAIVSKAVFEKEARGLVAGDLWPTTGYASGNKALDALAAGGALFLVTVRPDRVLWLVAILESPAASNGAWRAAANQMPITDVTSQIPAFAFANGKGLVRDDKLGMSLQTPRALSDATAAALRAVAGRKPFGEATQASAAKPAVKLSKPAAKLSKPAALSKPTAPSKIPTLAVALADAFPAPPRPPGLPDDARWDPIEEGWERGAIDHDGCHQGPWQWWRPDGTLRGEATYLDHNLHGTNRRFHPDGAIASEGTWRHGVIYDSVFFTIAGATDEPPLPEPIPGVVRTEYVATPDGAANATIRYFDRDGHQRDHAGALVPPRPPGVPDTARWFSDAHFAPPDATLGGWVDGALERGTQDKVGDWRWWSNAGLLLRTERYDARGREISITTLDHDDLEPTLAAWYTDPKDGKYALARAWSPELHARLRAELPGKPMRFTCEYIYLLDEGIPEYGRGWSRDVSQPRRVIEVVEDWEARPAADSPPLETWFMTGAGARAAIAVRDRDRLARWWKRFSAIATPKDLPDDTYAFKTLARNLDKKSDLRPQIEEMLDGRADQAAAETRDAMSAPATARDVDDPALARCAEISLGTTTCQVMLRDPDTGEAWLLDDEGHSHYWNGAAFAPTSVTFDEDARHDLRYVNQHAACDERLLVWPGKHGWLTLQRYGRSVFWHAATYYTSRGQAEVERQLWFTAASPRAAHRMMQLARLTVGKSARVIDPWRDTKLGVIVRTYSGGACSLGVNDNELGTGARFVERFASHAAAVRAFELIEAERLRSGATIMRLSAMANDD